MDWVAAINSRRVVSFTYDGHERVVIPAAYGHEIHTGNTVLRAYQVDGSSVSQVWPPWRLFLTELALDARLQDEVVAQDPPGYRRGDRQMSVILAER